MAIRLIAPPARVRLTLRFIAFPLCWFMACGRILAHAPMGMAKAKHFLHTIANIL
jgi:hypothetical protein